MTESHDTSRKRPGGLTVIAILWTLGALYNLYLSLKTLGDGFLTLPHLSKLPKYFSYSVPFEMVLSVLILGLGLSQLYTVYGLWTAKPWSHKLAIKNLIALTIINGSATIEAFTFPKEMIALYGWSLILWRNLSATLLSALWMVVYEWYFKKPHIKEYLGVLEEVE